MGGTLVRRASSQLECPPPRPKCLCSEELEVESAEVSTWSLCKAQKWGSSEQWCPQARGRTPSSTCRFAQKYARPHSTDVSALVLLAVD